MGWREWLGLKPKAETAIVDRALDGDSIRLIDGREVRYIGIDTPEIHSFEGGAEPWAERAKEANAHLVEGRRVRLEREISDRDRFGRLLRHVYVGRVWVNGRLVEQGLAEARAFPPDTRYARKLEQLEAQAKGKGRGLWSKEGWLQRLF